MPETEQSTLFDLPDHYVKDRAVWRRAVQRRRELTPGARLYAGYLAFHRWSKGTSAWTRERAARALGVTVRTIQRWNAELVAAGFLKVIVQAMPGRCQVFRLLNPQVRKGDTHVSPKGTHLPYTHRSAPVPTVKADPTGQPAHAAAGRPRPLEPASPR